ncbi:porin precursor [Mycobacteroides abscessus subsp. massiliense]|nr:porin precursor [Mycobacteroides abscessus subsp. massiliense]SKH53345.1 porin precursor [Mycobacteroides abscessus subsp. massiliense]SKH96240.1 porin precursor [Mycobacteroides abscessus subsp. massiliense]SKI92436.1 porin precursor [Mycobacteroides abscessus subsp. massiliense]SKJ46093.1 porin precursor [Mycobacteroides abscessus subsp. massiliense]
MSCVNVRSESDLDPARPLTPGAIRRRAARWLMQLTLPLMMVATGQLAVSGLAHAGLDDELTLVDGKGRTLRIQQWDTFLNGVSPLDRNRLTREWFHSGRAVYDVTGPDADTFEGTLELGYQVGYPWSLGVGLNFNYTTPNTSVLYGLPNPAVAGPSLAQELANAAASGGTANLANVDSGAEASYVQTTNLLPSAGINVDLSNGPGIQEVSTFSVAVKGPHGAVAVSNAHGTVTGAAGGVLLRPYARLVSSLGDSVTTYGENWDMN